jgi:hypothetical protein
LIDLFPDFEAFGEDFTVKEEDLQPTEKVEETLK